MSYMVKQSKKMILFSVLDILKQYTDENHRLSQKEIENILAKEYGMVVDRKTIKTSLMNLRDFGYEVEYSESLRPIKNKRTGDLEESTVMSDFYLKRDIEDSELRLLIDSLLFNRQLPVNQCKELIEKLEKLSSRHFKTRIRHTSNIIDDRTDNQQFFWTIDVIDEAISQNRKVQFKYVDFNAELKQIPQKDEEGKDLIFVVSPYQTAVKNGNYYLICNQDGCDHISSYRIDRIVDIELIDNIARPAGTIREKNGNVIDLTRYIHDSSDANGSDMVRARLKINQEIIGDVIDGFGRNVKVSDVTDSSVTVTLLSNEAAIMQFARQFESKVIVLGPEQLRNKVIAELQQTLAKYY